MRKTQVALAALALVASSAALADVTVSGYLDAGIQSSNVDNKTRLAGGLLDINKLIISGSEDIGDGLKAGFTLLTRFESTTGGLTRPGGTGNNAGNGTFFEIANVNVSSGAGTVSLGRTVDAFWGNGVAAYDVTGGSNLGSAVAPVLALGLSKVFIDNSVHYASPSVNGLTVAGSYVAQTSTTGSTIGFAAAGDYSASANYAAGALSVGGGVMKSDITGGYFLGAGYDAGFAKVNVVYLNANGTGTGDKGSASGINTAIPMGSFTITAGYYDQGGTSFKGTSTQLGAIYPLSKRSKLFANYQRATGLVNLNTGLSSPGVAADAGNAITLGVGHSF